MVVRHYNVMHHMMEKAATIWSKETGIDRNSADDVEVKRPDDQRERYLSAEEIVRLKAVLDEKMYRKAGKGINQTFFHLRLIVLTALTTGMRIAEIFALRWSGRLFREELIAVGAKLKRGKVRYVPMCPELAAGFKWYPVILGEDRIFQPEPGAKRERQRVAHGVTEVDQLPDDDLQIGVLLALLQDDAKNQASYLTWKAGLPQSEVAATLRNDFLVTPERADKLSSAWGRHPLLGRMYLPAYRAGTDRVAELRRRYPAERLLPALYGCAGLVDVTTIKSAIESALA